MIKEINDGMCTIIERDTVYVVSFVYKEDYGNKFTPEIYFVNDKERAITTANEMLDKLSNKSFASCCSVDDKRGVAISVIEEGLYTNLEENCCIHWKKHEIKFA